MTDYNVSGIYKITNLINGHCYVGSAVNIQKRWWKHVNDLNKNQSHSSYLQRAWNKYGAENFEFSVLELCFPFALILSEQAWMDEIKPEYNMAPKAGSQLGIKRSPEWIAKLAARNKVLLPSAETRLKMSLAKKGRKHSPETRAKLSLALTKRAGEKRSPLSQERRARLSAINKGKTKSPETRARMSLAQKGRTFTPEARAKMSLAQRNKKPASSETRAKLSVAGLLVWAKKKKANEDEA